MANKCSQNLIWLNESKTFLKKLLYFSISCRIPTTRWDFGQTCGSDCYKSQSRSCKTPRLRQITFGRRTRTRNRKSRGIGKRTESSATRNHRRGGTPPWSWTTTSRTRKQIGWRSGTNWSSQWATGLFLHKNSFLKFINANNNQFITKAASKTWARGQSCCTHHQSL